MPLSELFAPATGGWQGWLKSAGTHRAAAEIGCIAAVAVGRGQPANSRSQPCYGQSAQRTAPVPTTGVQGTAAVAGIGAGSEPRGLRGRQLFTAPNSRMRPIGAIACRELVAPKRPVRSVRGPLKEALQRRVQIGRRQTGRHIGTVANAALGRIWSPKDGCERRCKTSMRMTLPCTEHGDRAEANPKLRGRITAVAIESQDHYV